MLLSRVVASRNYRPLALRAASFRKSQLRSRGFIHTVGYNTAELDHEPPTYNQVGIQMISRELQLRLFGCEIFEYEPASPDILDELQKHGIDIRRPQDGKYPVNFPVPDLVGGNVAEHMHAISSNLVAPYQSLLRSLRSPVPSMPSLWSDQPGWTKYETNALSRVHAPTEDVMVLDTEVLMNDGEFPTVAVALTPAGWYSWVSPYLHLDCAPSCSYGDPLIPLYGTPKFSDPKCVIGHFASYDRARLLEEHHPHGTGTRFLDTLSLHIAVSGLTSTQRHLKTTATKHCFNNKLWKSYLKGHKEESSEHEVDDKISVMDFQWIAESSFNNLTDVYRLYCGKTPPQDKQARSVFECGTKEEVRSQFQELMRYCATDVLMTFDVFEKLMPLFEQRFPHPATLHGLLEMGSMYLPINDSWTKFQQRADAGFASNELRQKRLLMQLANEALQRYSSPDKDPSNDPWLWDLDWSKPKASPKTEVEKKLATLPKWYRELIPKPVKQNIDAGPALITAQMRIAPKLLRLCWQGLPLHFDQELKWGVLVPGRAPQPYGDPRYYEDATIQHEPSHEHGVTAGTCELRIRPMIPVKKASASGETEYMFPYGAYLSYWLASVRRRLSLDLGIDEQPTGAFVSAYCERTSPGACDDQLMEELQRSVQAMPLEPEERTRFLTSISVIREMGLKKQSTPEYFQKDSTQPTYVHLGEMQVRGPAFWTDAKRFDATSGRQSSSQAKSGRRRGTHHAMDTVNPNIPTCWFNQLPHDGGEGLPVGSPLARSFQAHIAAHRLHSADAHPTETESTDDASSDGSPANQLLRDRVHATFWKSYSKRIKSQMAVWFPHDVLPEDISCDPQFDPDRQYGAILPLVIPSGTVSRRAVEPLWLTASNADKNRLGSEIKAMVQAPPGYCFVGADVDSQEMWIAALIGDASTGFQGATPYGWMTLEGNKANGTDLHTKVARLMNITRSEAKVLNYARLYGSGFELTKHLLSKFSAITPEQASLKANQLLRETKGQRMGSRNGFRRKEGDDFASGMDTGPAKWQGGTESAVFNELESIARGPEPCTPVLKAQMTRALNPKLVKEDFLPSRINWVVQSSAVDYLHCMLTVMSWLIRRYDLPARLCISIHDEVRYLCRQDAAHRVALALQISNLFTRAFFAYQLGMKDLPESVAFFSSVEIDSCLRKSAGDDCITPSNPDGLKKTYNISPGQSLTMQEILEWTQGRLDA